MRKSPRTHGSRIQTRYNVLVVGNPLLFRCKWPRRLVKGSRRKGRGLDVNHSQGGGVFCHFFFYQLVNLRSAVGGDYRVTRPPNPPPPPQDYLISRNSVMQILRFLSLYIMTKGFILKQYSIFYISASRWHQNERRIFSGEETPTVVRHTWANPGPF